jgi:hypothetical protein
VPLLDLVGQLGVGPVTDGPAGLLGRLAGDSDDLDDLLGAEGGGTTGARRVVERGLDQAEQIGVAGAVGFGGSQTVGGVKPAVTPEADADAGESLACGDALQARVIGQREQDIGATDETHRGGLATAEVLQRGTLARRQGDARRTRAAHVTTRFSWQDRYLLLVYSFSPAPDSLSWLGVLGIRAARLARAVYHIGRKAEAFDEGRFWGARGKDKTGSSSLLGAEEASRAAH